MKFKFIEKEKKGFARYCPTFAKAYECMKEGSRKRTEARDIRKLARKLSDENGKARKEAALALMEAAEKGIDIAAAIPALSKASDDEVESIRNIARFALLNAANRGTDINAAIPVLVKLLGDGTAIVCENAATALWNAANRRDQKTRTLITRELIVFVHSDWLRSEMERNSVAYERIATGVSQILDKIKEAEEKEAA